jgi:hypothetical protein
MDAKIDYCWAKALEYTRRAEETTDNEVREFFYRLRDSWVRAANRQDAFESDESVMPVLANDPAPSMAPTAN